MVYIINNFVKLKFSEVIYQYKKELVHKVKVAKSIVYQYFQSLFIIFERNVLTGSINSKTGTVVKILNEYDYIYDLREIQNNYFPKLK